MGTCCKEPINRNIGMCTISQLARDSTKDTLRARANVRLIYSLIRSFSYTRARTRMRYVTILHLPQVDRLKEHTKEMTCHRGDM